MRANTRVLEWSCRIKGSKFEGARFLHTALHADYWAQEQAVDELFAFLFPNSTAQDSGENLFFLLRPLARKVGDGVALGYAEQEQAGEQQTLLKLYISTCSFHDVTPLLALITPPGAIPPPQPASLMIAASLDHRRGCGTRVYYIWTRNQLDEPATAAWLTAWCTPEEYRLIKSSGSHTITLSFKQKQRDMLYLTAPFHQVEIEQMVVQHLQPHPFAYGQLSNLRWVGFSKRGEGLQPQTLNVYFNSEFR